MLEPVENGTLRVSKRMKKRRQLDALVHDAKTRKKEPGLQLLGSDSSEEDDVSVRVSTRHKLKCLMSAFIPACHVLFILSALVAIMFLLWMGMHMREDMDAMRMRIDQLESSGAAVPTELHSYHSHLQLLQNNQTQLEITQKELKEKLASITEQLSVMQKDLTELKSSLSAGPSLISMPGQMSSLQSSVADLGSQLTNIKSDLSDVKNKENLMEKQQKQVTDNINQMKNDVSSNKLTLNNIDERKIQRNVDTITANMRSINSTMPQIHDKIAAIETHVKLNTDNITHLMELETVSKSQILDLNQTLESAKLEFSHLPTDLSSKLSNMSKATDKLETDVSKLISLSSADEYHRLEKSSDVVSQDVVVTTSSPVNRVVRSSKKKEVTR